MKNNIELWQDIRSTYLNTVEKALSKASSPRRKEVLADVAAHLDQKFDELADDQKTWENFQAIITDMGPATEYAELLEIEPSKLNVKKLSIAIVLVVAVIAIATIFVPYCMVKYSELFAERIEDNIDLPFEEDKKVLGIWESVDFIENINSFDPEQMSWVGGDLFLKEICFLENGRTTGPWSWTKGVVMHPGDKTAAKYYIKELAGSKYMFLEWKSGDYVIRHQKPAFYVLKKVEVQIDIVVKYLKLSPHREVKDAYYLIASIGNSSSHYCEPFRLHFYINDLENKSSSNHGGGPIEAGGVFNSASSSFMLKDGKNVFTTLIDTEKNINDPDRSNNTKTITVMASNGRIVGETSKQIDGQPGKGVILVEANEKQGFNFPYYLYIPQSTDKRKKVYLLVEPNNTGTASDDLHVHQERALKLVERSYANRMAGNLQVPLLVPVFPRPRTNWQAYTHALDIDTLEINEGKLKRVDLQLIAMIENAKAILHKKGYKTNDKVFMHGFSASAKFANRFAFLHPELVKAAACGGVNGMPTLPIKERNGHVLPFPIGIAGIEKISGKPFDKDVYKNVPQYIYMGYLDRNDTLPSRDAWREEEADIIKKAIAEIMMPDRWKISQDIYQKEYPSAQCVTYNGISHSITSEMIDDVVKFFRANSGDTFTPIKPHEYTFIEYQQIEVATVDGLYWQGDERLPENVRNEKGHFAFYIGIQEWLQRQDHKQYNEVVENAGFDFVLKADGHEDISIDRNNFTGTRTSHSSGVGLKAFCVKLNQSQLAKLAPGVPYTLHPVKKSDKYYWKVNDGVNLIKP